MFTGIVEAVGILKQRKPTAWGQQLVISTDAFRDSLKQGESVAVNGVCLTVAKIVDSQFCADAVHETLHRTTLSNLHVGEKLNLERAVKMQDRLGGHLVSGHVDGIGRVLSVDRGSSNLILKVKPPSNVIQFLITKGSVAIDGISLTVQDLSPSFFSVAVIPHTLANANLGQKRPGSEVNLEADMIAKYVKKFIANSGYGSSLTLEKLRAQGF